ncbi:hypothetical protein B0H13DRAFT_1891643 [Mycena leptocephala]|nr:hypothetical protein B0H13DRAFT_1891643 [Mycena leptocephala]
MARRVDDLARKLHNTSRKWTRAVKTKSVVREDLRRSKHNTVILRSRVDRRQEGGIAAALKKARVGVGAHWMKGEMGSSRNSRAKCARQVGRMIEEGGIASDIQVASEIQAAKAFTLSGDGTTIRHLNFEAKHVTYFRPGENVPVTRMLDTTSARNHTSEEQLAGWQDTIQRSLVYTYNASPLGQENSIDNDEFVTFIKGIGADHAPDQKKWVRLAADWVLVAHKIMAGKQYLSNTEMQSYMPEILRRNDQKIQDAGGINAWNALSEDEKTRRDIQVCRGCTSTTGRMTGRT